MKGLTKIVTASALGLSLSVSAMAADGAQNVSSIDQSTPDLSYAFSDSENLQVKSISGQEMEDTEGAVAPVYAVGVFAINTGRFIATRYVSKNAAASAARSGCNVMCYGSAQQARNLARQSYGRGNITRHGPSGHKAHVDYSHYQPTIRNGNNGHVFYGNRYPR